MKIKNLGEITDEILKECKKASDQKNGCKVINKN